MSPDRPEMGTLVQAGGETLLFDCGRGVPERLNQLGVTVSKVFLTHLHSDHTQGLPILWMGGWNARGASNLSVWGPAADDDQPTGTAGLTAMLASGFATNTHIRRDLVEQWSANGIVFDTHEVREGPVHESNGVKVTAFLVDHAPVKPAFGYRIDYAGRSVVISGDTKPSDNLVKFSKDVDVLIHEVFLAAVGATTPTALYHTLPEQAADVFNRAAPKLAVFSHIAPNNGDPVTRTRAAGYNGPLLLGSDLMTLDVGDTTVVKQCSSTLTPLIASATFADGTIAVTGSAFSPDGGNSLRFTPVGGAPGGGGPMGGGGAAAIVIDATIGLAFEESATRITAGLGGKVAAGQWMVAVRTACNLTAAGVPVTVK